MKRISTAIKIFIVVSLFSNQSINAQETKKDVNSFVPTSLDYDRLKAEGKLGEYPNLRPPSQEISNITHHVTLNTLKTSEPPVTVQSAADCDCWIQRDASWAVVPFQPAPAPDYRNDDYSTAPIALPFLFCLNNTVQGSLYINNNGNVSFGAPYFNFATVGFPSTLYVMVAPFWADVDTRNLASGLVYYQLTATHLIVQWDHVGYYASMADKLNTFQLIMTDGTDPIIPGGKNVSFCYKEMEWTSGAATSGVNGFGGTTPATVGVNFGDGTNYIQIGRFDAPGSTYYGPQDAPASAPYSGVSWLTNQHFEFDWCASTNVSPVLSNPNFCDTITLCIGQSASPTLQFLSPEQPQTTTTTISTTLTNFTVLSNNPGNVDSISTHFTAMPADTGFHVITFTATDNGAPPAQTIYSILVHVLTTPTGIINNSTNVSCFGGNDGTALVSPSGGNGAYTFSWSPSGGNALSATGLSANTYTVTISDTSACWSTQTITITQPPALTAVGSTVLNVSCHGGANGSATVAPGSGSPGYTYLWSPTGGTSQTASNLIAGAYTVTVTDLHGCTITSTATITEPAILTAAGSMVGNVSCFNGNNGSATVSPGGGTAPYTYLWSPAGGNAITANNLTAGIFTVTVTDSHGCTITSTATIAQPPALTAAGSMVGNVSCFNGNNGSATVNPGGGTAPYTYLWSPAGGNAITANNLTAGIFTVTVTDSHGCAITSTATIAQPPALTAAGSTVTNVSCFNGNNGSATVSPVGGTSPYTYLWSPTGGNAQTASNLSIGTYTVTVTDAHGCTITSTTIINQPTVLAATGSTVTNVACFGGNNASATVASNGGTGPYTYLWAPAGGNTLTANNLTMGVYTVTVTDAHGCSITSTTSITQPPVVTANASTLSNVSCSNAGNGVATVVAGGGVGSYSYSWAPAGGNASTASNLSGNTYTVTVTDGNGCAQTATTIITQSNAVTSNIPTSTNVLCHGGNNGQAIVNAGGGSGPGTYTYSWNTAPVQTTQTANNLIAGTYTVVVTDANGCTSSSSVTITEPPLLTSGITAHTDILCHGGSNGSATVTPGGGNGAYAYSWNTAPVQTTQTANNITAGTYTVVVTDANGCTSLSSVTVTEPPLLTSNISTHTDILCNGGTNGSATVTPGGGNGAYSYAWNTTPVQTSQTANNIAAGTYTVVVVDANGCTSTSSLTITQPPLLTTSVTAHTDILCKGGTNGSATVTPNGGNGSYTYAWNSSPVQTTQIASNLPAGNYTVLVIDANGCTSSSSEIITEPNLLTSAIPSSTNVSCNGVADGSTYVNVNGGTASYNYAWSPSGGNGVTASNLPAGNYSVTVTDANGCVTTSSTIISQPAILVAGISTSADVNCNGENNGSASVNVAGGTASYTYSWLPSGGNSATANNLAANTYTVVVADAHGCLTATSVIITEPPALISAINASTSVSCFGGADGSATVIANGGTAPYIYAWNPAGGTGTSASNLTAGNYSVNITDAHGCSSTSSVIITQPTALTLTLNGASTICISQLATISASPAGGIQPYNYVWSNGATTASQNVSPATTSNYDVQVTDANGCTISQSLTVTVNPPLNGIASATPQICQGNSGTVSATAGGGDGGPYNYTWSNGQTAPTFNDNPSNTTMYTVTINDGCSPPIQTTAGIIVNPLPFVNFTPQNAAACVPISVDFTSDTTTLMPGSTYLWNFGDGTTSTDADPSHVYPNPGQYSVSLTINSPQGCPNTLNLTNVVNAIAFPVADFIAPDEVSIENSASVVVPFSNTSTGSDTWQWNFGDNTASATGFNPSHTYLDTGVYTIQLISINSAGCPDTTYRSIHVFGEFAIFIPNAFTPNGDGINDRFSAFGVYVKDYDMWILDRWGGKIFHSTSITDSWDGSYLDNGTECQNGVYVYKIKAHDYLGKLHEYVGSVSLIR